MTPEEFQTILNRSDDFYDWNNFEWKKDVTISVPVEVVDSKFGQEGDWQTDVYVVVKVGNQYFKKTGYYASHDGQYFDGPLVEVKPVERKVEDWVEV